MKCRRGFTLVEMLVTLALVLFIMVILSEAFSTGLGTFRQLKAIGDMQEKLRSVAIILRHDLQNHYLQTGSQLSPPNTSLWLDNNQFGPPPTGTQGTAPTLGFFRIEQLVKQGTSGSIPYYVKDGTDPQQQPSLLSGGAHRLYFTIRIPQNPNGQRRENYLAANVPPSAGEPSPPTDKLDTLGPPDYQTSGIYYSQSAEVAYFLRSLGTAGQTPGATQTNPGGTPTQLFALFRRQMVLMDGTTTDANQANSPPPGYSVTPATLPQVPNYHDVSCHPVTIPRILKFNGLGDVAGTGGPNNRSMTCNPSFALLNPTWDSGNLTGPASYPILGERGESQSVKGDDLLLTNVVSFSVRVLPAGPQNNTIDFQDIMDLPGTSSGIYDTSQIGPGGPQYRIAALEITIRVWDVKTQQTRQLTILQDMGGLNPPSTP